MAKAYGEKDIVTLDPVAHIRMRPGMYVGEPGTGAMYHDCIYILLKEVIDNSIDEFVMGEGKRIDVSVDYATGETSVRDYGRGIPPLHFPAMKSQIDLNGHVNNVHYISWMLEPCESRCPAEMEVVFRSETFARDEVRIETAASDGFTYHRVSAPDGKDHILARTKG